MGMRKIGVDHNTPTLASMTTRGLLPAASSGKLLIVLLNKQHRQALHVHQLLGGTSQLQSPLTDGLGDPDCPCFCLEPLELRIDTGQVVVQFPVARDICSDAPVIKSVGCFGEVSMNSRGTDKELMEPGREGVDGFARVYCSGVDGE